MTFISVVYNEAKRIRHVLDHAVQWAEEIIIYDKGSTDGTLDICREYGDRVRVVSIPFSDRGHEDHAMMVRQYPTHEWVFFSTCSEVPTRRLIETCKQVIAEKAEKLDLIYVPRLMYFFGLHRSKENGGVAFYPFLFHKDRVVITKEIHDNFHATDPSRTHRIPYEPDCCVHHMTHPTVRSFWLASLSYFAVEAEKNAAPEKEIRESFKNIEKLSKRMLQEGESWLPFYCALASYELGRALSIWEKAQGPDRASKKYEELANYLIASEWKGTESTPPAKLASVRVDDARRLKPLVAVLARLPYVLVKLSFLFRRAKIKGD